MIISRLIRGRSFAFPASLASTPLFIRKSAVLSREKTMSSNRFFLIKSEPHEYSLEQLLASENQTGMWEGVRNVVASKVLKDMKKGDQAFFYYSSCDTPRVIAIVECAREHYPDPTQFQQGHKYFDQRATEEKPRWVAVDVKHVRTLRRPITLSELRAFQEGPLKEMKLLTHSRLSCQHVTPAEWEFVLGLEDQEPQVPPPKAKKSKGKAAAGGAKRGKAAEEEVEEEEVVKAKPKRAAPAAKRAKKDEQPSND